MRSPSVLRHRLTFAALTLLVSTFASAQAEEEAEPDAAPDDSEAASEPTVEVPSDDAPQAKEPAPASLRLVLFVDPGEGNGDDVSRKGIRISADGVEAETNEHGSASLDGVSSGFHDVLVVPPGEGKSLVVLKQVGFAAGEVTQILLTVDGNFTVVNEDIETPPGVGQVVEETPTEEEPQALGTIAGIALDSETGKPISGVQIYVRGRDEPLTTGADGRFSVEVSVGPHDISVLHSKYASVTREGLEVSADARTEVELRMNPSSAELEDMVITEPYVEGGVSSGVAEEKDSSAVQDVIGAEQMSKSGDSDASSALGRVTGLTVVGGKFIYVRGMGERYSSTLLNGAQVPSPEPERRVVPLDLFPTTVLESVVVQKTYSPDMPGEFGGGVVQLRTRTYPEEFLFKVSGSVGGNTNTTFHRGPTYDGGRLDWLGFDDGGRARSDELAAESKRGEPLVEGNRFNPGLTKDEIAALGRSLPNNWNTSERTILPDGKLSVTVGNTHQLGKVPVGYVVAAQYSNSWDYRNETRRSVQTSGGDVIVATSYDIDRTVNTIGVTGMGGLGAEVLPGQKLYSNTMILRNTDNTTLLGEGLGLEGDQRFTRLQFVERQLFTQQFRGEHIFEALNDFHLDWRFVYSLADRKEPDRRDYRYDYAMDLDAYLLSVRGGAVNRFYSDLDDKIIEGGADLTYPLAWTEELVTRLKGGGMILKRTRNVDTFRYQYAIDGYEPLDERLDLREEDMETIMDPDNIRADGVEFAESTGDDEPYTAQQDLLAAYAMVETPLGTPSLNLMGGVRYEQSRQLVESTNAKADLDTGDFLPAGTLTWAFIEDMQVRGGFSKTVSRPDFRELALARFFDVESSTEIVGNPDLERATILNYDVRYEWYFSGDESLTIAGFYKDFDKPIETVVLSGTSRRKSWQNADSATNIGLEFEGRKRLGFIADPMDSFYLAANVSLIKSKVQLNQETGAEFVNTNTERPLEGQSPYVVNVQFGFDDAVGAEGNLSSTVLVNVSGRRIDGVGANGAPDTYEEAAPQLDFVTTHKVDSHWSWGFKVQNILNPVRRTTQGPIEVRRYRKGLDLSLSASYSY